MCVCLGSAEILESILLNMNTHVHRLSIIFRIIYFLSLSPKIYIFFYSSVHRYIIFIFHRCLRAYITLKWHVSKRSSLNKKMRVKRIFICVCECGHYFFGKNDTMDRRVRLLICILCQLKLLLCHVQSGRMPSDFRINTYKDNKHTT